MGKGSGWNLTILATAGKASALHGMDEEEMILRPKNHPSAKRKIFLGQTASAIFDRIITSSNIQIVDFSRWDEQKWSMAVTSNGLEVEIESFPYWGFGLFSNGYANKISLRSQEDIGNRLLFDVVSMLDYEPWSFKHPKAIERWITRNGEKITLSENRTRWENAQDKARQEVKAQIELVKQRCEEFESKLDTGRLADSVTEAYEEIEMASLALEDRNIPAAERALSRCEALLINIDEILNPEDDFTSPHGHVLLGEDDDGVTFVDLTVSEEE